MARLPDLSHRLYNPSMARLSNLHRLSQTDEKLRQRRERLEEIDRILAQNQRVKAAEQELQEAKNQYVAIKSQTGEAEQTVSSQRAKIEKTDKSLYSGSVTNPKELEELQMEAESLRRYMDTLEDRLLEAMVELEETEATFEAAKNNLERTRSEVAAEQEELSRERAQLTSEVERLETEREAAVANVADPEMNAYQDVLSKVGRLAVAVLESGNCGVCGMAIPASKQQAVRGGDEVIRCGQCGRILYGG